MGFIDFFERTLIKAGYVKKGASAEIFASGGLSIASGRLLNQRQQMRAYLDWVYAAASAVALDVATIEYQAFANRTTTKSNRLAQRLMQARSHELVGMIRAGKLEEIDNHILLDLLDRPNPMMNGERFTEMTVLHMLLAGEAFWGKLRNGLGKPGEIWPMFPYAMSRPLDDRKGWLYTVSGEQVFWPEDDVTHIVITDPNSLDRGMSIVRASARAIETDTYAADWNRSFFRNSARPDLYLETEQTLNDRVFSRMKEQWNDEYQGTANAHKVAILEAGLKASKAAMTQTDMEFLEGRKFNRDQILAMFGVSKSILGLIEDANRANMEAADYNHAKRVVKPLMSRITAEVQHSLATEYDKKLVISYADPVPEDKMFALKERTESVNKYRTINEVREDVGLEKLPGGDVIYQPLNLVPLTKESETPPEPVETDPADDNPDDGDKPEGEKGLGKLSSDRSTRTTINAS